MEEMYVIYKATNTRLVHPKVYIGFTKNFEQRKKLHEWEANRNPKYPFQRAIRKYGKAAFNWEVIYCSKDADHCLKVMEPYFIQLHKANHPAHGYNLTTGGDGLSGYKWEQQKLEEMNQNRKKYWDDPEHRKKHSITQKHVSATTDRGAKIGTKMKEIWKNPACRRRIMLSRIGTQIGPSAGRAKSYQLCWPDGKCDEIRNLTEYCRDRGISKKPFKRSLRTGLPICKRQYKGCILKHKEERKCRIVYSQKIQ